VTCENTDDLGDITGYIKKYEYTGASSETGAVYYKWATGSESNPTITDPGNHVLACIISVRNISTSDPFDTVANDLAAGSTPAHMPSITTSSNYELVFAFLVTGGARSYSGWTAGNLDSITERVDINTAIGGNGSIGIGTGLKTVAGSVGDITVTIDATIYSNGTTFALNPVLATPSSTPSNTTSRTPSATVSNTKSSTPSHTESGSKTPSFTPSATQSPSSTVSRTPSSTPSHTFSQSSTPSHTVSSTVSHTLSSTPSATPTIGFDEGMYLVIPIGADVCYLKKL
jgi:hypothetical protein